MRLTAARRLTAIAWVCVGLAGTAAYVREYERAPRLRRAAHAGRRPAGHAARRGLPLPRGRPHRALPRLPAARLRGRRRPRRALPGPLPAARRARADDLVHRRRRRPGGRGRADRPPPDPAAAAGHARRGAGPARGHGVGEQPRRALDGRRHRRRARRRPPLRAPFPGGRTAASAATPRGPTARSMSPCTTSACSAWWRAGRATTGRPAARCSPTPRPRRSPPTALRPRCAGWGRGSAGSACAPTSSRAART